MASLFAPAFTVAVAMNPLWSALGAGMLGPSLVNDLGGEVRQFALAEMNRTSMTTVAAALVAVSEFTSHDWIGQIDVPVSVLVTTRDTIVPAARQRRLAEAIPHATMGYGRGRSRGVHRRPGPVQREAAGSVPGTQTASSD
jgi:pimeloyl-ACP methyl ester carboxylesterase